ncbi:MAG: cytochrome c biogenesis protein ResB, partial [Chloroflexota bacterium]|nr:cytochrome c biogenesis protein ResB [Chloroflexota bacterium]
MTAREGTDVAPAAGTVRTRVARRSIPDLVVDRIWRFFCSVRAAIWEIAILALLVLIGTLRGSSVPRYIADALPVTEPIVDRWYAWDVFRSLPFMAMLTLLSVAIAIGGIINRAPGIWAAIARPTVTTTHGFLRNAERSATLQTASPPTELAKGLSGAIRASGYRVLSEERGGEVHLYGDRFRFARLATFPFHVALILVLVGGIVGARWGFRETEFIVTEGTAREVGHGTDLTVRVDEFTESYRENGQPAEYRSDLTLLKDGEAVESGSITVNNPLTHGQTVFYQSGFGQAVVLRVADAEGRVLYDGALPLEFVSTLNADAPAATIDLPPAGMRLTVIAPDGNPLNAPEQDMLRLNSGELYFLARPLGPDSSLTMPTGVKGWQGRQSSVAGLTVDFVREKRFTVLQVARNPGIPIFLVAAVMMVGGLAVTFYFPHRRVRGIVAATPGGGSRATLAPMARRDW